MALGVLILTEAKVFDIWYCEVSTEYIERQGRDGWQLLAWQGASLRCDPSHPFDSPAFTRAGWQSIYRTVPSCG